MNHYWGKLIGGILGLLRGGITGAIFGVFLGHMLDRFLSGLSGVNHTRDAFFGAVFSTLGHINKARQGGAQGGYNSQRQTVTRGPSLSESYAALGLAPEATAQEVKRAYRKLVSQYHPDKLVSRGLPDEMMEIAKKRVREINTAYDKIKASREIK